MYIPQKIQKICGATWEMHYISNQKAILKSLNKAEYFISPNCRKYFDRNPTAKFKFAKTIQIKNFRFDLQEQEKLLCIVN